MAKAGTEQRFFGQISDLKKDRKPFQRLNINRGEKATK